MDRIPNSQNKQWLLENIEVGDVGVVRRKFRRKDYFPLNFLKYTVSRSIQRSTDGWANHVFGVYDIVAGRKVCIVEALGLGVGIHSIDKYLDPDKYDLEFYRIPEGLSEPSKQSFQNNALLQVDDYYDLWRLVKIRWQMRIHGARGFSEIARTADHSQWICSQLIAFLFAVLPTPFVVAAYDFIYPSDYRTCNLTRVDKPTL